MLTTIVLNPLCYLIMFKRIEAQIHANTNLHPAVSMPFSPTTSTGLKSVCTEKHGSQ
jgi:hypothetical protein